MKNFLKYLLLFFITIFLLIVIGIIVCSIPKKNIVIKSQESLNYFINKHDLHPYLISNVNSTKIDNYADSVLFNIIYSINENKPLESFLLSKYYFEKEIDPIKNLEKNINENVNPNELYMRYWHGTVIFLRPMLIFLNIGQIKILNIIVMAILLGILISMLWRKNKQLSSIFLISLFFTYSFIVPFCIEFTSTYIIMLIISILIVKFENKEDDKIYRIFFLSGMLTCFFDFLTTETLTLLVPLIFLLVIRYDNKKINNFKNGLKLILNSGFNWSIAYILIWFLKWGIVSIILSENAFDIAFSFASKWITGGVLTSDISLGIQPIIMNLNNLFPLCFLKFNSVIYATIIFLLIIFLFIVYSKNKTNRYFLLLLSIIAIIPYFRYMMLSSHSYVHEYFTYRAQLPTLIVYFLIIIYSLKKTNEKIIEESREFKEKIIYDKYMEDLFEITILMPCLNEEETIEECIDEANYFINKNNVLAEILVIDNGSVDNSLILAKNKGARVLKEEKKGYGSALKYGINNARGKYIIILDSDMSYDFRNINDFIDKLKEGYALVVGNRFKGKIEKKAMPFSHRYIGNPILSFLARKISKANIGDFHCGIRAFEREKVLSLKFETNGMEFATELIFKFQEKKYKITEVPTILKKDKRNRKPHLKTISDGLRHLKYMIKFYICK